MKHVAWKNSRATDQITFLEGSETDRAWLLSCIRICFAFLNDITVALRNSMLALAIDLGVHMERSFEYINSTHDTKDVQRL